jgi:predicted 2-oxoglutarate/Fe(II)-dependent dioxygenase YbiX
MLSKGDFIPNFTVRLSTNPSFQSHNAAGRVVVFAFLAPGVTRRQGDSLKALSELKLFGENAASLFFVTLDPADEMPGVLPLRVPGVYGMFDSGGEVRTILGVPPAPALHFFVVGPRLQIAAVLAGDDAPALIAGVEAAVRQTTALYKQDPGLSHPPVLVIPDIFEKDLCRTLIEGYQSHGGRQSGFMRDRDGKTREEFDARHKVRRDWNIEDEDLLAAIHERISARVAPEVKKAFQFDLTRIERHIVACYTASDGGHFKPHRDDITLGTAHRRFAMSLNLNAEKYEGGDLRFPEFGPATYRAPTGGGVVFSCSLLHEATKVTQGERYACLPFFYDEAAEQIRLNNLKFTDQGASGY